MIFRHSAAYLLARGLPGLATIGAMAAYTRIMDRASWGLFVLVVAVSSGIATVGFTWVRQSLMRYLASTPKGERPVFFGTVVQIYLTLMVVSAPVALVLLWLVAPDAGYRLALVTVLLVWAGAWFDITLEIAHSDVVPRQYALMNSVRAAASLIVGISLVAAGLGALGASLGLLMGFVAPVVLWRRLWSGTNPRVSSPTTRKRLVKYGLPFAVTFVLSYIVSTSDRLILAIAQSTEVAGVYALGYDLSQQSLVVIMMAVNLAGYPLVLRALQNDGPARARSVMAQNGALLVAVALPSAAGLMLLAPNVAETLLGQAFASDSAAILPWIAGAAFLMGLKSYYFDLAFQLAERTALQIWILLASALVNITLNLFLIPKFGALGAAIATLAAYATALALSCAGGLFVWHIPLPLREWAKSTVSTLVMAIALIPTLSLRGPMFLGLQILLGLITYGVASFVLDTVGMRTEFMRRMGESN